MAEQTKTKKRLPIPLQYVLYACFLLIGALLIVGLPQYYRFRTNGKLEGIKALDELCEDFDVKIIDFRHRIIGAVLVYGATESDTPAGKVEYYEVRMFEGSDTPEKLELSSEESTEFSNQVWEILMEYRGANAMNCIDAVPPVSPYRWKLMELPSGESLAIWYQEDGLNQLHLLTW